MPDDRDDRPERQPRDDAARAADHAGIGRLADGLVPALIAKLGALNVGELEVREGDWRVRLRRPAGGGGQTYGRRSTDRPSRSHPGHEQHGHAPGAIEGRRAARGGQAGTGSHASGPSPAADGSANGSSPSLAPVGPGRGDDRDGGPAAGMAGAGSPAGSGLDGGLRIAASPAVGVFQPGPKAAAGSRVRAGDRLGAVDMLGVPQEVVAPVDGIVVGVIVEAGTAVEYGQELIEVRPAAPTAPGTAAEGH